MYKEQAVYTRESFFFNCLQFTSEARSNLMEVPEYLPPAECEGKRLNRFEHYKSRIKWLERLDDGNGEEDESQSYVFRVEIEKKEYAVKVVSSTGTVD